MRNLLSVSVATAAVFTAGIFFCSAAEAQWGTLKGQILLDGEVPKIELIHHKGDPMVKDPTVCAAEDMPNEKLVIDPTTKGIANVVVYLQKKPAKIHPDLEKSATPSVAFDQKGCRFLPHVMVVRTDQEVLVMSDDAVAHNTHSWPLKNTQSNFVVTPNERKGIAVKTMQLAEKLPTKVTCDIHPWMIAYWVIVDHPYATVTNEKGEFEIPNLPVGAHDFTVWQESAGYLERKYSVTIKEGENTQKPLKFTASQLLK